MKRLKFLLIIISLYFSPFIFFGQSNKVDSLLILLRKDRVDTNKVIHLNNLCMNYTQQGLLDTALCYSKSALLLSSKLNYTRGLINSNQNIGFIFLSKANYASALKHYLVSIDLLEKVRDKKGIYEAYSDLGYLYMYQKYYSKSMEYHFKVLKYNESIDNKAEILLSLKAIGGLYESQLLLDSSLNYYKKSLNIATIIADKKTIADILYSIGNNFVKQEKYNLAFIYFEKARVKYEEAQDTDGIIWSTFLSWKSFAKL